MARIRTIKPEFFTSEDIVQLSPFARLLYISLWCEADREGRMQWKPRTFKMRYFPADDIDMHALCEEILNAELVVLYGEGCAYIPKFSQHQHINPRESASTLPDPHASARVEHASARVQAPSVTHREEGKGKEGVDDASQAAPDASPSAPARLGSRLPNDWTLPAEWREWALQAQPTWSPEHAGKVADSFKDFWIGKAGKDGRKADWEATWRNWVRREQPMRGQARPPADSLFAGCE